MTEPIDLGYLPLWTPTTQGLPPGAGAVLSVRARAVKSGKAEDARELREELATLGVVVRDEGGKQYWRRTDRPVER